MTEKYETNVLGTRMYCTLWYVDIVVDDITDFFEINMYNLLLF